MLFYFKLIHQVGAIIKVSFWLQHFNSLPSMKLPWWCLQNI